MGPQQIKRCLAPRSDTRMQVPIGTLAGNSPAASAEKLSPSARNSVRDYVPSARLSRTLAKKRSSGLAATAAESHDRAPFSINSTPRPAKNRSLRQTVAHQLLMAELDSNASLHGIAPGHQDEA